MYFIHCKMIQSWMHNVNKSWKIDNRNKLETAPSIVKNRNGKYKYFLHSLFILIIHILKSLNKIYQYRALLFIISESFEPNNRLRQWSGLNLLSLEY